LGIKTEIPWCDSTLNLLVGCDGCELVGGHCYAEKLVSRWKENKGWPIAFDHPTMFPDRLAIATGWSDLTGKSRVDKPWLDGYPRMIFVNDMGDTFTDSLDWRIWKTTVEAFAASSHIYLLLTKRPGRAAKFVEWYTKLHREEFPANVWVGTSVTGEATQWRLAPLMTMPVHRKFVSFEPLLTPASLSGARVDWAIVGGESGESPRTVRPFQIEWARAIQRDCHARHIAYFFKQGGTCVVARENCCSGPEALDEQRRINREWPLGTMFGNRTGLLRFNGRHILLRDKNGRDMAEFPSDVVERAVPAWQKDKQSG
jgi:protein gp37